MEVVGLLSTGALAGWTAGFLMRGAGYGLVVNIAVGIAGSIVGAKLFNLLGIAHGDWLTGLVAAVVGAVVLLALVNLLRRAGRSASCDDAAG